MSVTSQRGCKRRAESFGCMEVSELEVSGQNAVSGCHEPSSFNGFTVVKDDGTHVMELDFAMLVRQIKTEDEQTERCENSDQSVLSNKVELQNEDKKENTMSGSEFNDLSLTTEQCKQTEIKEEGDKMKIFDEQTLTSEHNEWPVKLEQTEIKVNVEDEKSDDSSLSDDDMEYEVEFADCSLVMTCSDAESVQEESDKVDIEHNTGMKEITVNCSAQSDGKKKVKSHSGGRSLLDSHSDRKRKVRSQSANKSLDCTVCNKTFTQSIGLTAHIKMHTVDKLFRCSICTKSFAESGDLKTHMRTHTGDKQHSCSACDKSSSNLTIDNLFKPYSCSICTKAFPHLSTLKEHLKTHTGDKPHKCSICDKSFAASGSLKRHMRTHTGEKPHSCTVCDKSFARTSHLKRHMSTHTGEKPYSCTICTKSFARSSHLKRHMETHTK